ncbi:MAG: (Fe-S)-binding protein [Cytophagales bacterium]|nr:MAG: (Fe-S)-binding protein [Cytophagales bacterium]
MKVALFIPCYIDQFYPNVGIATVQLLEKFGCEISFPLNQTCCGQPMANSGCESDACTTAQLFVENFKDFEYIVAPSASCVYFVKKHFNILPQTEDVKKVRNNVYDLSEFLIDVLKISKIDAKFPFKVGLHTSCHGQRGMRMAQSSEINAPDFGKQRQLLNMVKDLELVELDRKDECCGFGGTFCVSEEAVSAKMGKDRVADHKKNNVQVLTGGDVSCLMHLEGIIRRENTDIKVMHLAEILISNFK